MLWGIIIYMSLCHCIWLNTPFSIDNACNKYGMWHVTLLLSVYVSVILRVCQLVGFFILFFFPWKIVKYVTFLHAMISFPVSTNSPRHANTLLSIYRVCGTFYECFYNNTLNISNNSLCINGVLYEMCPLLYCTSAICNIMHSW